MTASVIFRVTIGGRGFSESNFKSAIERLLKGIGNEGSNENARSLSIIFGGGRRVYLPFKEAARMAVELGVLEERIIIRRNLLEASQEPTEDRLREVVLGERKPEPSKKADQEEEDPPF